MTQFYLSLIWSIWIHCNIIFFKQDKYDFLQIVDALIGLNIDFMVDWKGRRVLFQIDIHLLKSV